MAALPPVSTSGAGDIDHWSFGLSEGRVIASAARKRSLSDSSPNPGGKRSWSSSSRTAKGVDLSRFRRSSAPSPESAEDDYNVATPRPAVAEARSQEYDIGTPCFKTPVASSASSFSTAPILDDRMKMDLTAFRNDRKSAPFSRAGNGLHDEDSDSWGEGSVEVSGAHKSRKRSHSFPTGLSQPDVSKMSQAMERFLASIEPREFVAPDVTSVGLVAGRDDVPSQPEDLPLAVVPTPDQMAGPSEDVTAVSGEVDVHPEVPIEVDNDADSAVEDMEADEIYRRLEFRRRGREAASNRILREHRIPRGRVEKKKRMRTRNR